MNIIVVAIVVIIVIAVVMAVLSLNKYGNEDSVPSYEGKVVNGRLRIGHIVLVLDDIVSYYVEVDTSVLGTIYDAIAKYNLTLPTRSKLVICIHFRGGKVLIVGDPLSLAIDAELDRIFCFDSIPLVALPKAPEPDELDRVDPAVASGTSMPVTTAARLAACNLATTRWSELAEAEKNCERADGAYRFALNNVQEAVHELMELNK